MSSELTKAISEIEESFYQMEHVVVVSLNQRILYKVAPVPEITCTSFTEADTEVEERSDREEDGARIDAHTLSSGNNKEQEELTVLDISSKLQKEMLRLRTTMSEKDLENQRLLCVVEEAETVHKPLIQSYTAKISEKVSDFMKFMQDRSNDSSNDELEQMKGELQDLTIGLELAAEQIGRRETVITLNNGAKHRQVEEWLISSISVPPPSDSGLVTEATSVRSIDSESSDIRDPIFYNELEVEPDRQDSKT